MFENVGMRLNMFEDVGMRLNMFKNVGMKLKMFGVQCFGERKRSTEKSGI